MAGAGVAAGLPLILTPGKAKASVVIRYADDGGRTGQGRERLYIKPFMEKTGIEVRTRTGDHKLAKLKAMIKTGNLEVDVSQLNAPQSIAGMKEGLSAELDTSRLDLSNHAFPQWVWSAAVAWEYYSGGLGYNTETIEEDGVPQSWADFWDVEKFPGRRGIRPRPQETLEKALMADGVTPKDLYPLDVDRAFEAMDRIKEHIDIRKLRPAGRHRDRPPRAPGARTPDRRERGTRRLARRRHAPEPATSDARFRRP